MKQGLLIDVSRCVGCGGCVMACKRHNGTGRQVYWCNVITKEVGTYPNVKKVMLPVGCQHCENAPCVRACPTGASHYDSDGNVQVDFDKCIGCRMCMGACPYQARFFNWGSATDNPHYEGQEPTVYDELCAERHPVGVVEKCTRCADLTRAGKEPACVKTCPAGARVFGDLDDPASEISRAIVDKHARQLLEEYGTKPSVYYVGLE